MTRASNRKSDDQISAPLKTARLDSVRSGISSSAPAQLFLYFSLMIYKSRNYLYSCELFYGIWLYVVDSLVFCRMYFLYILIIYLFYCPASSKAAKKVDERIDELYAKYANRALCVIEWVCFAAFTTFLMKMINNFVSTNTWVIL